MYYGDEIGMSSAGDPFCRGALRWDLPETWDQDLKAFYQQAIALRLANPVFRTGDFSFVYAAGQSVAYRRRLPGQEALVGFNAGLQPVHFSLPIQSLAFKQYRVILPGSGEMKTSVNEHGLTLDLPAQSAVVLLGTA